MDGDRCPAINKSCTYIRENAALRAQLKAAEAREVRLREGLEKLEFELDDANHEEYGVYLSVSESREVLHIIRSLLEVE